ncbi:MAG: alkaline phosphatase [Catalinimonas sp.]
MKRLFVVLLLLLSTVACRTEAPVLRGATPIAMPTVPTAPPNVIFLIGDGMGMSQVSAAYYYGTGEPNFARFPVIGLSRTSSATHKITDSAAGATAFSGGEKTYNGAIGVDTAGRRLTNLYELLAEHCPACPTGVVSTSAVTHATPASFFAHEASRDSQEAIATQLAPSPVDFFAGGGQKFFYGREDGLNYLDTLRAAGFVVNTTALRAPASWNRNQRYGYLLADNGMPKWSEGRGDFLPSATRMALDYLKGGDRPFFLMVEGSQIDWGGHANDGQYIVEEMLDFDRALGVALDYAEREGNTLVVVTADHETGGFTLRGTDRPDGKGHDYDQLDFGFSSGGHSATMVPVFAYGPGAEAFAGTYQNTAIFDKFSRLLQLPAPSGETGRR